MQEKSVLTDLEKINRSLETKKLTGEDARREAGPGGPGNDRYPVRDGDTTALRSAYRRVIWRAGSGTCTRAGGREASGCFFCPGTTAQCSAGINISPLFPSGTKTGGAGLRGKHRRAYKKIKRNSPTRKKVLQIQEKSRQGYRGRQGSGRGRE